MYLRYLFILVLILGLLVAFEFVFSSVLLPDSNFTVCTGSVDQVSCYDISPTPTLNWSYSGAGSQAAYWIQVDNNSNYSLPEVNTGWVSSSGARSYVIPSGMLSFNTAYYWRIMVRDNFGSESNWINADSFFTTVDHCNRPPTATSLNVTGGDSAYYCGSSPTHYFSWIYSDLDGHNQTRFQFQVDNNSDFSSPEINRDYTGFSNPSPTTNNQTVSVAVSPEADQIAYNTTYYWRVIVYDSREKDSGWVSGSSFTTESHLYPSIDFNWAPQNPSQEEDILFADQTTCYEDGNNPVSCTSWSWTFQDGNPDTSNQQNPTIQFVSGSSKDINLEVTDASGYTCSDSKNLEVGIKLPSWREILPW